MSGLGILGAAVSGAAAGADKTGQQIRDKSVMDINEAQESRKAQQFEWQKAFGDIFNARKAVDEVAQPPPAAAPGAVQGAIPSEGGQPPPAVSSQGAALPTEGGQPPPAAKPPSRREKYNQWFSEASRLATLTGGLEGYQKFQEMENATSRRQVLGYGLQAIRAMDEGNVGEAMKAGNTALESTPFDTGLKFEAKNGQLHLVGQDGKPGEPLTADALRAFTEDNMKTPEAYLDWKAQYETERKNLVTEKQTDTQLATGQMNAESTRRQADQFVAEGPGRDLLRKAQAYAALARGKAALSAGADGEEGLAWNENNILKIEEMGKTAEEGGLGFGGPWMKEQGTNSELNSNAIGAAVEIRVANPPNGMTHQDAATLARLAYFNELVDQNGKQVPIEGPLQEALNGIKVFQSKEGNFMVEYKGKQLIVPKEVGMRIQINRQQRQAE